MIRLGRVPRGLILAAAMAAICCGAQVRHFTGQDVAPVFEGWERNADGSFNMVFGYTWIMHGNATRRTGMVSGGAGAD